MSDGTYRGVVIKLGPVETVGEKGFQKRLLVVCPDMEAKYRNLVPFEITGDALKEPMPDEGDVVEVEYRLRGREWQGRYFCNINAVSFNVERAAVSQEAPPPKADDEDEIPF